MKHSLGAVQSDNNLPSCNIYKQEYVDEGGSLMVMLGEGGENEFNTNINFLLEQYGMVINSGKSIFTIVHYAFCNNVLHLLQNRFGCANALL